MLIERNEPAVDIIVLSADADKKIAYIQTDTGKIDISPPIQLKSGEDYMIELFSDGTIRAWQLIADGQKGLAH